MEYRISDKFKTMKPSAIREIFKSLGKPGCISFAAGNPAPDQITRAVLRIFFPAFRRSGFFAVPVNAAEAGFLFLLIVSPVSALFRAPASASLASLFSF